MEDGKAGVKAGCRGRRALEEAGGRGWEVSKYDVEAAGGRMNDGTAEATGLEAQAEVCHHCIQPQVSAGWSMKCLQDTLHILNIFFFLLFWAGKTVLAAPMSPRH
jgi:hypothetical protein